MPLGICHAPGTFCESMEHIPLPLKWKVAWAYLDDIIILSQIANQCIKCACSVLSLLHRVGVTLSLKKWKYFIERCTTFWTRGTLRSIGTHFSYHCSDTRFESTSNIYGPGVIPGFLQCTPTFRSQLPMNCCRTQSLAEKAEPKNSTTSRPRKRRTLRHYSRTVYPQKFFDRLARRAV